MNLYHMTHSWSRGFWHRHPWSCNFLQIRVWTRKGNGPCFCNPSLSMIKNYILNGLLITKKMNFRQKCIETQSFQWSIDLLDLLDENFTEHNSFLLNTSWLLQPAGLMESNKYKIWKNLKNWRNHANLKYQSQTECWLGV